MKVRVIGGGLSGSEAALQLANFGFEVELFEMRPNKTTGAHKTSKFAEFVCSNSLGSIDALNASGELKEELKLLGSYLINVALDTKVDAGGALAVDRELFSEKITKMIENNNQIEIFRKEITSLDPEIPTIVASGPLTSDLLSQSIKNFLGEEYLHFFDAIAPIIEKDSINFEKAFFLNRYNKGSKDYINCPMNKDEYLKFYDILVNSPQIELKDFEKGAKFFESCLPIEVLAQRDINALRFGPMKPIGLVDERTSEENYAVVQLRQDNQAKSLYNMVGFQTNLKWGAQTELIHSIPGLEKANIVRYGVMHRNTFINSPKLLSPTMQSRKNPNIFFAGQLTGTEGYTEAIATGLLAGINMERYLNNKPLLVFPKETILGALVDYISFEGHKHFQPINSNWGIVAPIELDKKTRKDKKLRNQALRERANNFLKEFLSCLK